MEREEVAAADQADVTADRAFSNPLLALARLAAMALWTVYCYPSYITRRVIARGRVNKRRLAGEWSHHWFRGGLRATGARVSVRGQMPDGPVFLAPNHLGYVDVLAIGGVCETLFVSKLEVESWPIVGLIFRHGEGIGVSRAKLRGVHEANRRIAKRLQDGVSVCVFLEGTSSGGGSVKPFHASLVQAAIDSGTPIVPVAMTWSRSESPINIIEDVAYWKDHAFGPHLWRLLGLRGLAVEIAFGEPLSPVGERKQLAADIRERVVALLAEIEGEA